MATDTAVITITVEPTVTAVDDTASTQAGQAVTVPVLANDMVNGAPATVAELDGPPTIVAIRPEGAGTATVDPETGDVEFTPAEGFCGSVEIDYEIERTCESEECVHLTLVADRLYSEGYPGGLPDFEFGVTGEFTLWIPGEEPGEGGPRIFTYDEGTDSYGLFNDWTLPCIEGEEGWHISYETGTTPPSQHVECVVFTNQCG